MSLTPHLQHNNNQTYQHTRTKTTHTSTTHTGQQTRRRSRSRTPSATHNTPTNASSARARAKPLQLHTPPRDARSESPSRRGWTASAARPSVRRHGLTHPRLPVSGRVARSWGDRGSLLQSQSLLRLLTPLRGDHRSIPRDTPCLAKKQRMCLDISTSPHFGITGAAFVSEQTADGKAVTPEMEGGRKRGED